MRILKSLSVFTALCILCPHLQAAPVAANSLHAVLEAADKYNQSMKYEKPESFRIYDEGKEKWIDYSKYGEFKDIGTENYSYVIKDEKGLKVASGEGIYPNTQSVLNSRIIKKSKKNLKATNGNT